MVKEHTDRQYAQELQNLKDEILKMGGKIEEMIIKSIEALVRRDSELAKEIIATDEEIDGFERNIDAACLNILALRQPIASDLRFIATTLKIVTDLERIGDMAVNIAERALELNKEPELKPYIDIPRMAAEIEKMIKDCLDAFVWSNPELAEDVCKRDDFIDNLNDQIFREVLTFMMEDPKTISRGMRVIFISKYLERIADHTTNIAQMVIFMVKGEDIRHLDFED
jgi:phosphate transport system protein